MNYIGLTTNIFKEILHSKITCNVVNESGNSVFLTIYLANQIYDNQILNSDMRPLTWDIIGKKIDYFNLIQICKPCFEMQKEYTFPNQRLKIPYKCRHKLTV